MSIDHLADERIWSESIYADCVSPDGSKGFMLRLGRYPNQNTAWLWAFAFLPGQIYGYNDHYLWCPDVISAVEGADLTYGQYGDAFASFHREGPRDSPSGARVSVSVGAHRGPQAPHGMGTEAMGIEAEFQPVQIPWRINPYRSEWIGKVTGTLSLKDQSIEIQGFGHFHEQHQKAPRWQVPFTYMSLRGEDLTVIGTATQENDMGHAVESSHVHKIATIDIDPPADQRRIRIGTEEGKILEGLVSTVHRYSTPIYSAQRPGTLVTAQIEGHTLSGCVNDWHFQDA